LLAVVLIILPLNVIGAEQAVKIAGLIRARPVHVVLETISAELIEEICSGYYTHVLLSPELLVNGQLRPVLKDPEFRFHAQAVILDEVHLLSN